MNKDKRLLDGWVIHDEGVALWSKGESIWFPEEMIKTFITHFQTQRKDEK